MKLKDIFSQNTNKIGWLKTFKKLGADNEVLKKLSKEIDNAGNNTGGSDNTEQDPENKPTGVEIKEYYYAFDGKSFSESFGVNNESIGIIMAHYYCNPIAYIILNDDEPGKGYRYETYSINSVYSFERTLAFKVSDIYPLILTEYKKTNKYYGDIYTRLVTYIKSVNLEISDEEIEGTWQMLGQFITPITKEEYYALNDCEIIEYGK